MTNFSSPVKSRPEGFSSPKKLSTPAKPQEPAATPVKEPETLPGPSVKHLYRVIQKSSGAVGGYGHNGPVYGEITMGTFQKVVNAMVKYTGFEASSSFVDIGSGLGKPSLHVALNPGVQLSCGIEVEELRWQLSMHNLRFVMDQVQEMRKNVVYFAHADATKMDMHSFTHIYMFDVGFPPAVLLSLADAFNESKSAQALVSFQPAKKIIEHIGFDVKLVHQVLTRMNGSTEGHTAYIYVKNMKAGKTERITKYFQATTQSPVKTVSEKPTKTPVKTVSEKPTKTPVKTRSRTAKPKVASKEENLPVKVHLATPTKSEQMKETKNKGLDQFRKMDYGQYVSETGLVGVPGERSQRAVAATRKNYKY